METGSNNLTVEGSSSDSLNGLKFGQKIYFEDSGGGGGVCGKSTALTTTVGGGGGVKKGGKSVVQSGQPPRCQVEGCKVDLSDTKAYYSRHKVCVLHSKSSLVIVNGLEQRFCQQCSRFHRLPEFDQGKRSCRRRLAGHNERRRKPPPGSLLSSRFGRLSSSLLCDNTRKGGVLLDFSSHSRHFEKDLWPASETSEQVSGSRSRSIMWQGNSMDPLSKMYLQNPTSGSNFSYPSGECNTGVSSDSTCALSLLSNQTWSSGNRSSGTGLGNLVNIDGVPVSHSNTGHDVTAAQFPSSNINSNSLWGFKSNNNGGAVDCGLLGQFSQPHFSGHFHGDLVMDPVQDGGRHYMDVDHSRVFDSTTSNHVDWSL